MNTPLHGRSIVYPGLTFAQPESFYRLRVCESQPLLVSHMSGQFVNLPLIFLWKLCNWGVVESGGMFNEVIGKLISVNRCGEIRVI